MAFAVTVSTLIRKDAQWVEGPEVLLTKNSFSHAQVVEGMSCVQMNDGATIFVNQTVQQMEDFLNGA